MAKKKNIEETVEEVATPVTRGRKAGSKQAVLVSKALSDLVSELGEDAVVKIARADYLLQHTKLRNADLAAELGV